MSEFTNKVIAQMAELESLRAQNAALITALDDAATSLETIAVRSFGESSRLDSKPQMRGYAGARAKVAREALAATKEES